jgi:thiol-disulfide isomerase/thioredoxin
MKNITSIVILLLIGLMNASGQKLQFEIDGMEDRFIYLTQVEGEDLIFIDSIPLKDEHGVRNIDDLPAGQYYLYLDEINAEGQEQPIELILNHEDIVLKTSSVFPSQEVQFLKSVENNVYHKFKEVFGLIQYKVELIYPLLKRYPERDNLYIQLAENYVNFQKQQHDLIDSIADEHPELYATKIIRTKRVPVLKAEWTEQERLEYLKTHFFDPVSFDDPSLIRSSAYTESLIHYLSLYQQRGIDKNKQTELFKQALNVILPKINKDQKVYNFLVNYMIDGFERYGLDQVNEYIAGFHEESKCNTDDNEELNARLQGFLKMSEGKTVPDFSAETIYGESIRLSRLENDYVLIVFWASWCPHCMDVMPDLKSWYENERNRDIEVVAFSLDRNEQEWKQAVKKIAPGWIDVSELRGWESEVAESFFVYSTPTFFIVDKDLKIISKPASLKELKAMVSIL